MDTKTTQISLNSNKVRLDELLSVNPDFSPPPAEIYDVQIVNALDKDILVQSGGSVTAPIHDYGATVAPGQTLPLDRLITKLVFVSAPTGDDVDTEAVDLMFKIV